MWVPMCSCLMFRKTVSLESSTVSGSYTLSALNSAVILGTFENRDSYTGFIQCWEFCILLFSLDWSLVGLWVSHNLLQINVSLMKLKDALIYEHKVKSWVISLILWPLNRIIVVSSLLRFTICLVISSRPDNGSRNGFHLMKWDLIPTRKGMVTDMTSVPLLHKQAYLARPVVIGVCWLCKTD